MKTLLRLGLLASGCAKYHAIMGQVLDRNGKPVGRASGWSRANARDAVH